MLAFARHSLLPIPWSLILLAILSATPSQRCLGDELGRSAAELLTPIEVQEHLTDPSWRILDARRAADYHTGHIPGAVRLDTDQWVQRSQQPTGLKDTGYWSLAVANLGIDQTTSVVVYADNVMTAARVWWLLAYLGAPRVAVLDGGWQAWEMAGQPKATETPRVTAGNFRADFASRWLVETEQPLWARESAELQIIDARSEAEYTGQRALGGRAGRIPHAIHLGWLDVLAPQSYFREAGELKQLLQAKGISPTKRQVVYCYSGARSSVVVFALRRIGYPDTSNYYGGWQQWSAVDQASIETGSGS